MNEQIDFLKLAAERYSVRKFENRPIEKEDLQKILQAGHLAPTGCNNQPQRVLVMQSEEAISKLRKCTKCHFGAPAAMLICYNKNEIWTRPYDGKNCGVSDACIVTTHMMLEAANIGVGTCWVMYFDPAAMRKEFAIPEELEPVALLVMGYPAKDAKPAPGHNEFREMSELVVYDTF